MRPDNTYDAVVVGARCAGAATAMLLARRGIRVLVLDRGQYGTDTLSTHALMRGGVLQLHRWGVLPEVIRHGTPPVRSTTFHYGAEAIEVAIRPGNGVDALYAPRRMVFAIPDDATGLPGALAAKAPREGTVAYLCEGPQCSAPVDDLARLVRMLRDGIATHEG